MDALVLSGGKRMTERSGVVAHTMVCVSGSGPGLWLRDAADPSRGACLRGTRATAPVVTAPATDAVGMHSRDCHVDAVQDGIRTGRTARSISRGPKQGRRGWRQRPRGPFAHGRAQTRFQLPGIITRSRTVRPAPAPGMTWSSKATDARTTWRKPWRARKSPR